MPRSRTGPWVLVDASSPAVDAASGTGAAVPDELLRALHLDASPPAARALGRLEALTAGLSDAQRWGPAGLRGGGVALALGRATGRRSLKASDFVVGGRIGEGSFGVVYYGAVVPKDGAVLEERAGRARTSLQNDDRYKEKVILKKIKVGTVGAKECGDYEEWFNYRVARAAPETCAEFMGSFVADKTKSEFVKGGKWLVWKFEPLMFGRTLRGLGTLERGALVVKQSFDSARNRGVEQEAGSATGNTAAVTGKSNRTRHHKCRTRRAGPGCFAASPHGTVNF
ncbi:hypothetical protein PR202_ga05472 [Eleusine coracana subsp. coracana]|uniref:Uncharacterized protein n=1 Tax=Eleusine coracana subsp. coracana TaxID=191504 RepID=A0AAV5BT74_ELECO|nr:hypothetical protein PR202_ga05019 [Eleusine coracana subsp. coracana]GJM89296.1 hypothetical protein PR202_ga05472 [Eleusine coracana subsp. coracana]